MSAEKENSRGAARSLPEENPYPHFNLPCGIEVTAWPDGLIGAAYPGTVVNFLLEPSEALDLAAALTQLASETSARSAPKLPLDPPETA